MMRDVTVSNNIDAQVFIEDQLHWKFTKFVLQNVWKMFLQNAVSIT